MQQQVNVRLPSTQVRKLKLEALKNNVSLQGVMFKIVGDFFEAWTPEERAKFFKELRAAKGGPKIKLENAQ
jgi:hypothetical protein